MLFAGSRIFAVEGEKDKVIFPQFRIAEIYRFVRSKALRMRIPAAVFADFDLNL